MSAAHSAYALDLPSFVSTRSPLDELARDMIEAGRLDDRERFDRLYSLAYGIAYGAAWRETGDVYMARSLAIRRLLRVLKAN